jgi:hypothetical protein
LQPNFFPHLSATALVPINLFDEPVQPCVDGTVTPADDMDSGSDETLDMGVVIAGKVIEGAVINAAVIEGVGIEAAVFRGKVSTGDGNGSPHGVVEGKVSTGEGNSSPDGVIEGQVSTGEGNGSPDGVIEGEVGNGEGNGSPDGVIEGEVSNGEGNGSPDGVIEGGVSAREGNHSPDGVIGGAVIEGADSDASPDIEILVPPGSSMLTARSLFIKEWKRCHGKSEIPQMLLHKQASAAWMCSKARAAALNSQNYSESELKRRRFA